MDAPVPECAIPISITVRLVLVPRFRGILDGAVAGRGESSLGNIALGNPVVFAGGLEGVEGFP